MLHSQTVSTLGRETNSQNISDPNDHTEVPFLTSNLLIPSKKKKKFWKFTAQEDDVCYLIQTITAAGKCRAWEGKGVARGGNGQRGEERGRR